MKLVFATNNANKLQEIRAILGSGMEVLSLADINCHDDIPETAPTLEGNALIKALPSRVGAVSGISSWQLMSARLSTSIPLPRMARISCSLLALLVANTSFIALCLFGYGREVTKSF